MPDPKARQLLLEEFFSEELSLQSMVSKGVPTSTSRLRYVLNLYRDAMWVLRKLIISPIYWTYQPSHRDDYHPFRTNDRCDHFRTPKKAVDLQSSISHLARWDFKMEFIQGGPLRSL